MSPVVEVVVKLTWSVTEAVGYPLTAVAVMVAALGVLGNWGPKLVWLADNTTLAIVALPEFSNSVPV